MRRRLSRRRFMQGAAGALLSGPVQERKRIGFVDYNLDNFHSRVYLKAIREDLKGRGYTVAGGTGILAGKSRAWAKKNTLPYFETVKELGAAVDCFVIMAPANPEVHLDLCRQVFPFSRPTYVDKPFAPDAATAGKIFALADEHKVAMQTSSALRYTAVQKHVAKVGRENVRHMVTWGGGSNYDEYVIHPVELLVSCMGHEAVSLMRRGKEPESQLLVNFTRGRTGVVNVFNRTRTRFAASVTTKKGTDHLTVDNSRLFVDTAAAILDLFDSGKPAIDRRESLTIMRILDASRNPAALKRFVKL